MIDKLLAVLVALIFLSFCIYIFIAINHSTKEPTITYVQGCKILSYYGSEKSFIEIIEKKHRVAIAKHKKCLEECKEGTVYQCSHEEENKCFDILVEAEK